MPGRWDFGGEAESGFKTGFDIGERRRKAREEDAMSVLRYGMTGGDVMAGQAEPESLQGKSLAALRAKITGAETAKRAEEAGQSAAKIKADEALAVERGAQAERHKRWMPGGAGANSKAHLARLRAEMLKYPGKFSEEEKSEVFQGLYGEEAGAGMTQPTAPESKNPFVKAAEFVAGFLPGGGAAPDMARPPASAASSGGKQPPAITPEAIAAERARRRAMNPAKYPAK